MNWLVTLGVLAFRLRFFCTVVELSCVVGCVIAVVSVTSGTIVTSDTSVTVAMTLSNSSSFRSLLLSDRSKLGWPASRASLGEWRI